MTHLPTMAYNLDGTFISIYLMTNAFANFLGPFIAGNVMKIKLDPNAPSTDYCYIGSTDYINDGCEVTNITDWMAFMIVMIFLSFSFNWYYSSRIINYRNEERTGVVHEAEISQNA